MRTCAWDGLARKMLHGVASADGSPPRVRSRQVLILRSRGACLWSASFIARVRTRFRLGRAAGRQRRSASFRQRAPSSTWVKFGLLQRAAVHTNWIRAVCFAVAETSRGRDRRARALFVIAYRSCGCAMGATLEPLPARKERCPEGVVFVTPPETPVPLFLPRDRLQDLVDALRRSGRRSPRSEGARRRDRIRLAYQRSGAAHGRARRAASRPLHSRAQRRRAAVRLGHRPAGAQAAAVRAARVSVAGGTRGRRPAGVPRGPAGRAAARRGRCARLRPRGAGSAGQAFLAGPLPRPVLRPAPRAAVPGGGRLLAPGRNVFLCLYRRRAAAAPQLRHTPGRAGRRLRGPRRQQSGRGPACSAAPGLRRATSS